MADSKEFESLDELFRKTFDNLPETPSQSGWDAPSERVWQHVQSQIKPPQSGWSTQTLTLIATFAVTLAIGLYLFLKRPTQSEIPVATPPPAVTQTTEQPTKEAETTDSPQLNASETATLPVKTLKKKPATANRPSEIISRNHASEAAKEMRNVSSSSNEQKPSGKKPVSPNTTERRKAELAKRAEEAWKTPLPFLPQRWPDKSNK